MKSRRYVLASTIAALVGAAACSSASNSVTGTVGGTPLNAQDAIFANVQGPSTSGTVVAITSFAGFCDDVTKNQLPKNAVALSIEIVSNGGAVTAPGTFTVSSSGTNVLGVGFDTLDAMCNSTTTNATAGTLTVTSVSTSTMTGTFDLTFGSDHLTGSFNAQYCAAVSQATGSPTCI